VKGVQTTGKVLGKFLKTILGGAAKVMEVIAQQTAPNPSQRLFWISPYVSFAPTARSTPQGLAGDLGNFAQTRRHRRTREGGPHMNREGGMDKDPGAAVRVHGIGGSSSADLSYTDATRRRSRTFPVCSCTRANAFAAAQVYYIGRRLAGDAQLLQSALGGAAHARNRVERGESWSARRRQLVRQAVPPPLMPRLACRAGIRAGRGAILIPVLSSSSTGRRRSTTSFC